VRNFCEVSITRQHCRDGPDRIEEKSEMTRMSVAERLEKAAGARGKSQREIAAKVGYTRPNVLSMMKLGQTKVPIEKAPLMAETSGVDPADFTRHVMQEYHSAVWEVLAETFGEFLTPAGQRCLEAFTPGLPPGHVDFARFRRLRKDPVVPGARGLDATFG